MIVSPGAPGGKARARGCPCQQKLYGEIASSEMLHAQEHRQLFTLNLREANPPSQAGAGAAPACAAAAGTPGAAGPGTRRRTGTNGGSPPARRVRAPRGPASLCIPPACCCCSSCTSGCGNSCYPRGVTATVGDIPAWGIWAEVGRSKGTVGFPQETGQRPHRDGRQVTRGAIPSQSPC